MPAGMESAPHGAPERIRLPSFATVLAWSRLPQRGKANYASGFGTNSAGLPDENQMRISSRRSDMGSRLACSSV